MHGCISGFTFLVNSEVDSMGGVVDCGVALDTKASPHRAAIAKTQEELRLEYDVREERRRELEFLEKGGNPLDYKFGRATSISVQSTSLRDQLAEQYVLSEAKGSFARATSPHGDSVESSGRPTGSLGREPNIADNLLLFAGENSSPGKEKITKRTGKRSNPAPAEQSSKIDGCRNLKDPNDLVIFHLGPRGQAYARRNRSRTSRDGHNNKSLFLHSATTDDRDVKESHVEVHADEHTFSSIISSKPTSPNAKRVQKSYASKGPLDMEIDGGPTRYSHTDSEKSGLKATDSSTSKRLKDADHNATSVEQTVKSSALQTPNLIGKDSTTGGFLSVPSYAMDSIKGSNDDDNDKSHRAADVDVTDMQKDNVGKENVSSIITEVLDAVVVDKNPSSVSTSHLHGSAEGNNSLTFRIGSSSNVNSKDHTACPVSSGVILPIENRPITSAATYLTSNGEARTSQEKFNNSVQVKDEIQLCEATEDVSFSNIEFRTTKKYKISPDDDTHSIKAGIIKVSSVGHNHETSAILPKKVCSTSPELQNGETNQLRLATRAHEDTILREAWMIETTLKKAAAPSISCMSSENRKKCHWDFVLEEMAWMANDFMQERLWKTTAAAQVCHRIASVGRSKFKEENLCQKQKNVARTLAKAVMSFWSSVGDALINVEALSGGKEDFDTNLFKASNTLKVQSLENGGRLLKPGIRTYALRLLQYLINTSSAPILAEAPKTPDRIKDTGSFGVLWDDQHLEEGLFYKVLPGAMRSYRDSMESDRPHLKVEEYEASNVFSVPDGTGRIALEEDESETGTDLPGGFQGNYSSMFTHKRKKVHQPKLYATKYEVGNDLSYEPCLEGKSASHSVLIMGKRPSGIINATAVPTKRTRTAARQRIISPFTAGSTGAQPVTSKTDVSSGDTTSFQDDQSSRYGCSQLQKNLEVDSTVDFERFLPFDSSDIPMKPKKKKKPKHFGYKNSLHHPDSKVLIVSGNRLHADYMVQHDQSDYAKKRAESLQYESNGNTGFYGQIIKKPKLSKRTESPEPFTPACRSIPSPVASQMSNMSNSNKLIKIISNRDRGRKSKTLKMMAGQSGPGMAWSTFEDQALVVLVHDMGLNWELVSDAFNSTLNFKCIYRKPIECKERHKFLMDKSAGDGADSAEDSGSSQPYPSTLPGIPKGSARQLFQRLQGPMEEDTMKSHFEKIILIWQRLHPCRTQDSKQQLKQVTPSHSSHAVALSQACPNNLSGPILSPLDLSDAVNSNPDIAGLGCQGSHTNGIVIPGHQGSLTQPPTSSTNTMPQGTPNTVLGSGLLTPSTPVHPSPRDAQRYVVPRSTTLPVDDQKRLQQYSQNFSGRNMQQSGITMSSALPAGVDRGVRMLAGGNGMGMMCGVNRSISLPRTSFQGVSPTGMLNMVSPNNMLSSGGVGISNPMGAHSSAVSSPGNTMLRPRDALQMLRPGQTPEEHRQIMMQEIQLQIPQGNAQAISSFNGMSASFSNAPIPPIQTIPVQQHQTHQIPQQPHIHGNPNNSLIQGANHSSSQQHAYIRFAKESQLQQRGIPQAQHAYSGSTSMSPLHTSSQFQQQSQPSSPVNSIASSQPQHKQQHVPHNPQTNSSMSSQILKQRQRQQVQQHQQQQQPRNLQQSKQQVQQQAKLIKGLGRGTMLMHQNLPVDATQVGGRPTAPTNQVSEKLLVQQSMGFNHGSTAVNSNLQQPSIQQKLYSRPHLPQSKQVSPIPSQSDTNQASIQAAPSHAIRATQQPVPATPAGTQQRQANQSPTNMRRIMLSQKRHSNHESRIQSVNEPIQMNQIIPSASLSKTADSSSTSGIISSGVRWKQEPSFETCSMGDKAQLAALPQESFSGNDAIISPSTHGLVQKQLSGNISIHGHGVGGQWQQQQQLQPTPLPPQQHRQGVQGNLCSRSANTGP